MTARPLLPSASDEQANLLMSHAGERVRSACSILSRSYLPSGTTHVEADICDGVQFLCKAALANCDELIALGHSGALEDAKQYLLAAVSVLEMCFQSDALDIDAAFGVTTILTEAEKALEQHLDNLQEVSQ